MNTPSIENIKIANISIPQDRARELNDNWVEALAGMIEQSGLINAISVIKTGEGYQLVSGHHRLAAFITLEREEIPARLSQATNANEARLEEVIENIGRNELNALDRAQHLFELDTAYKAMHPELNKGGDKQTNITDENRSAIFALRSEILEQVGLSRRSFFNAIAIWKGLSEASKANIQGTWLADHQAGLQQLASEKPAKQKQVCNLLFSTPPKATNVTDALTLLEVGRLPTHFEKKYQSINKALTSLKDEELDNVFGVHEAKIMDWLKRTNRV
ncbi:ParB/RepB/Spo0J family partition protein [Maritalea porphyrae]|uniref:ParB/RepB/Spo0J family partition protein n=1 Tax=Maritalea porphyrae TaxID=880732 RepID=UPI0022AE6AA2|nr:ParB/RepB/Spo0J family partition protein [Maritalea porphyrae]MCZ4273334.1 ParB/RepB/Spo0J family partition protein [Maritalea porphyrae]